MLTQGQVTRRKILPARMAPPAMSSKAAADWQQANALPLDGAEGSNINQNRLEDAGS